LPFVSDNRIVIVLLSVPAVVTVGVVLAELRSVLLPFAGAVLLSYLFKPLVVWLTKKGIPMPITLVTVLLVVAVLLAALGGILYSTTSSFVAALPRYEVRVTGLVTGLVEWANRNAEQFGLDLSDYIEQAAIDVSTLTSALQTGLSSFVGFFGNVLIVVLFLMFMLAGTGNLLTKIGRAFSSDRAAKVSSIARNIDRQIRDYLLAKTLVSLITGVLTSVICLIMGVDFAILWGFLAFVLNFIPTFGSIVATIFPVFIALLQFPSLSKPILVLTLLMASQFTMGNVVEPRLMGIRLNLSPLAILFSIIFWAWLWGPWGMVLAVPITASIKIVFENIKPLKPISVLMSGLARPDVSHRGEPATYAESPAAMTSDASE
jgi:predicted PurR-regulated permease PerM